MLTSETLFAGLSNPTVPFTIAIVLLFTLYRLYLALWRPSFSAKAPTVVSEGLPIVGAWRFWDARWDFLREWIAKKGNFSFYVGRNRVVAVSGEAGRRDFFDNKELDFGHGYFLLTGGDTDKTEDGQVFNKYFANCLSKMLKGPAFVKNLPKLLDDLKRRLNALAESGEGITDPFDSIYEIVFQLTMRTVGCNEVADDPVLLKKTFVYNQAVEYTSTPAAIMFPWFPSPGILKRLWAGTRMYMLFDKVIKDRKNTGRREDDALQFMMDQGDGTKDVITVVFGSLFAGLLNSGINAAWILVYLAVYPEWLSKIREEVVATAAKHSADPKAPLVDQLSSLPIEIWESGFPLLDLCLRDSIRLQLVGAAFRKNATNHDIKVGNATIPPGVFVTYPLADIHHDQDVYLDSHSWDPSRYFPDRAEDKKKPYAYLGWGVGRHPCVGMRFAKLENNIITAFWLAMFDYELVDGKGNLTRQLPNVNINAFTAHKPNPKVYFKYKVRK